MPTARTAFKTADLVFIVNQSFPAPSLAAELGHHFKMPEIDNRCNK
jgi:hypothetical protein